MTGSALQDLAEAKGILPRWRDMAGQEQVTTPDTQRALLAAMGISAASEIEAKEALSALRAEAVERRLPRELVVPAEELLRIPLGRAAPWRLELEHGEVLSGGSEEAITVSPPLGLHHLVIEEERCLVIAAPPRAPMMEDVLGRGGLGAWGVTAALYGLRSSRNLGLGDYRDLAGAAAQLASLGAAFIGINPVHARGAAANGVSPYSPSCRTAFEPRHIAIDAVPGFASCGDVQRLFTDNAGRLETARSSAELDYDLHAELQDQALRTLFRHFRESTTRANMDFDAWQAGPGAALTWFARFEALSLLHGNDWRLWPADLQVADNHSVVRFAADHADEVRYHSWLQWLAEGQILKAQAKAKQAGMALGLYLDVAVGVRPGGADSWAAPACFAKGVSLGAPPDAFNPAGQSWSLAPFNPIGLRESAYQPFVQMLRNAMSHAGIIRIDHILGINRSFWVPEAGASGGYVSYPMEALLALIRIEAQRSGCIVVGEDLGSVPEGLRDELAEAGLLGCAVMQFEKEGTTFRAPAAYRPTTLASFATHDTPTVRGWWSGWDIALRCDLGQTTPEASAAAETQRAEERGALGRRLAEEDLAPEGFDPDHPPPTADDDLVKGLHGLLAKTASQLRAIQLDDALGVVEQQNLPGTINEYPNWRRRYPVDVDALADDPGLVELSSVLGAASRDLPADKEKQPCQ